jgi:hypothetical protein
MGIPITYRRLTVYRGRLQREKDKSGRSLAKAQLVIRKRTTKYRVAESA